jgi:ribosomal protein S21
MKFIGRTSLNMARTMNKNYKLIFGRDPVETGPLQIVIAKPCTEYSFMDAFRKFKSLVQKERIIGIVKEKMAYEKPSQKKRRKSREAVERNRITAMREQQIQSGEWDKRQKKRQQKKQKRLEINMRRRTELGEKNE